MTITKIEEIYKIFKPIYNKYYTEFKKVVPKYE